MYKNFLLTSSWKNGWSPIKDNQTPQIIELQSKLSKYGCSIFSLTKDFRNRQNEILEYIASHEVNYFVIIDDDECEYNNFKLDGVYQIDAETGFTQQDAKRIKWKKIQA